MELPRITFPLSLLLTRHFIANLTALKLLRLNSTRAFWRWTEIECGESFQLALQMSLTHMSSCVITPDNLYLLSECEETILLCTHNCSWSPCSWIWLPVLVKSYALMPPKQSKTVGKFLRIFCWKLQIQLAKIRNLDVGMLRKTSTPHKSCRNAVHGREVI